MSSEVGGTIIPGNHISGFPLAVRLQVQVNRDAPAVRRELLARSLAAKIEAPAALVNRVKWYTYTLQDSHLKTLGGANSQHILCIECMSGLPKAGDFQFLRRT